MDVIQQVDEISQTFVPTIELVPAMAVSQMSSLESKDEQKADSLVLPPLPEAAKAFTSEKVECKFVKLMVRELRYGDSGSPTVSENAEEMVLKHDSGAQLSVMSRSLAVRMGFKRYSANVWLQYATGSPTRQKEQVSLQFKLGRHVCNQNILVLDDSGGERDIFIMGMDLISKLRVPIPTEWTEPNNAGKDTEALSVESRLSEPHPEDRDRIKSFMLAIEPEVRDNQSMEEGRFVPGEDNVLHLNIQEGVKISVPDHTIPYHLLDFARNKVRRLLEDGRIELASQSENRLPLFVVPKYAPDGSIKDVRIILDCRAVNKFLKPDKFPIPHIKKILSRFQGYKYISELDARDAFHCVKVDEDSRRYLCFAFDNQLYRFVGTPLGLVPASNFFQRTMMKILSDLPFASCYIDNVVIISKDFESHLSHVKQVISRLTDNGIFLNIGKCNFLRREMRLLGHVVTPQGISPDPDKVTAITEWPLPRTAKQIQRFVGMVNFLRDHLPLVADHLAVLDGFKFKGKLNKQELSIIEPHFEKIKKLVSEATLLNFPDLSRPFSLMCDASKNSYGAVLYQPLQDSDPPSASNIIAFASRSFTAAERAWSTYKKELMALLWSLQKWHDYLWFSPEPTRVYTDHRPLLAMETQKPNLIIQNWFDIIAQYHFILFHVQGVNNLIADALSRRFEVLALTAVSEATLEQSLLIGKAHERGHYGVHAVHYQLATVEGIKWPNMLEHIQQVISSCPKCAAYQQHRPYYSPLSYSVLASPFTRLQADLLTSLPDGVVLVIVDCFTGYLIARPLANKKAATIAAAFQDVFGMFGIPAEILTDNGSEFIGNALRDVNNFFEIRQLPSISHNPRRQGQVERAQASIAVSLRKMLEGSEDWKELLPLAVLFYNSKLHSVLKLPPFVLFFNRRPRFAQDDESEEFSLEDWTRHQAEIIAQLFPAIESKVRNVKLQRAIEYAKRHITEVPSTYSPGTHVMALDHNRSTKNEPVYVGPYVVECRMTDHSILLRDPTTNAIVPSTVATHHLKPVQPPLNYPIQPRIMSSLTLAIRKHR